MSRPLEGIRILDFSRELALRLAQTSDVVLGYGRLSARLFPLWAWWFDRHRVHVPQVG